MGFFDDLKDSFLGKALLGVAGGTIGSGLGSALGGWTGGLLGGSGQSWGQKIGGAIGGAAGAALPQQSEDRTTAALLGGYGGWKLGPSIQSAGQNVYNKLTGNAQVGANQPVGATALSGRGLLENKTQPQVQQGRSVAQAQQVAPTTPGVGTTIGGIASKVGQAVERAAVPAIVGAGAEALLGPKQPTMPTQAQWSGPGYQTAMNWANFTGGNTIPGLVFDANGNVTGVDPNAIPDAVKLATAQIDELLEQKKAELRSEAARAGMLSSGAYLKEMEELEADAIDAKKQIYSQYVYDQASMANQRAQAGLQYLMQMGSVSQAQYAQEMQQYEQKSQQLADMVSGIFAQMESEKQVAKAQAEKQQEQQYYGQILRGM